MHGLVYGTPRIRFDTHFPQWCMRMDTLGTAPQYSQTGLGIMMIKFSQA